LEPLYLQLHDTGTLRRIIAEFETILHSCSMCPHNCGVDRHEGQKGKCKSGILPFVSSFNSHFGEESCLVGRNGSGTIFFGNCNLSCIFCQNYDISHMGRGEEISFSELAKIMMLLQTKGVHNINFVSPTHMIYAILRALELAIPDGLKVPLVYNTGGYDSAEIIKKLNGVFDIYMPDFKYMDPNVADELSGAEDYPSHAMKAVREMHNQVGDLYINRNGVAERGLLVRHLVLPNNLAATDRVISFIADVSKDTYINIMDQYRPEYRANECFDLKRRVTLQEFDTAVKNAKLAGLTRIDGISV
jgi:putative pyruvate formate lyase activating enzyme